MNQLLLLCWNIRELFLKVFEPKDEFDRLIYRLKGIDTRFLRDVLSYNNITARVRSLRISSRKLDSYLKWVVTMEREEKLELVIADKAVETSVYLTDFFTEKGVLQDAVADFEVLKLSMIRFIRLYQTYALSQSVSFERDYFIRMMNPKFVSIKNLIEDLHGLSNYGTVTVRE